MFTNTHVLLGLRVRASARVRLQTKEDACLSREALRNPLGSRIPSSALRTFVSAVCTCREEVVAELWKASSLWAEKRVPQQHTHRYPIRAHVPAGDTEQYAEALHLPAPTCAHTCAHPHRRMHGFVPTGAHGQPQDCTSRAHWVLTHACTSTCVCWVTYHR